MAAPDYPNLGDLSGHQPAQRKPGKHEYTSEEIAQLKSERDIANARVEATNEALKHSADSRRPRINPEDVPPPEPGPTPNPATDPAAFEEWLAKDRAYERWRSRAEALRIRDEALGANRSVAIIDNYLTQNPQFRNLRSLVVQAYREALEDLKLQSLPEDTRMLDATAHKKVQAMVAAASAIVDDLPTGEESNAGGEETPPRRTSGLSGGSRGATASRESGSEGGEKIKTLTEVIRERQAKSGLF